MDRTFEFFVGVDWATTEHLVCLLDAQGQILGEHAFAHSGAGLTEFCAWLLKLGNDEKRIAVAIEVPHGAVVETLLERGFAVHAINPKQLDRFRDRFTVAGRRMIGATRTCSQTPCARTATASADCKSSRNRSSSFASGLGWPRIFSRSATD